MIYLTIMLMMIALVIPKRQYKLRPFWCHSKAIRSVAGGIRWVLLRAGRRSGKTEIAKRAIILALAMETWHGAPANCLWCGPTLTQTKEIAWEDLKAMVPAEWIAKISETELKITTRFGSTLKVAGLDKPHRIEGSGYDFVVVDERSDVKPEAISRSIVPALLDRKGKLWEIGVPKRFGVGSESYNKRFDDISAGRIKNGIALEWKSSEVVPEDELEELRTSMTAEDFAEQFEAMVLTIGGQVYYAFSEANIKECTYDKNKPLIIGSDFNVDPMCWTIGQEHRGPNGIEFHVIGLLWKRNTNTYDSLDALYAAYGGHTSGWIFHGDASSSARRTSSVETDLSIIANDKRFINKRVIYPNKNPKIEDRLMATNAMMCNAKEHRRLFIDPNRCEKLITDYKNRSRKEGKRELDDGPFQGHLADSCDYIMYARYPVRINNTPGKSQIGLVG